MKIHQNDDSIRKHYVSLKNDTPSLNAKLLYAGELSSNEKIKVEKHSHSFYEFIYFNSGKGKVCIDGKEYSVKKGFIAIYKKNSLHHEIGFSSGVDGKFFAVKSSKELDAFCSSLPTPVIKTDEKQIYQLLTALIELSKDGSTFSTRAAESLAESLIYLIMQAFGYSPKNRKNASFESILAYINEHFTQKINFSSLCHEKGVDRYYICVLFKERLGVSPVEYLTSKRIDIAKSLLSSGNSVSETARLCGFENAYYFSKVFKKSVGVPPSKYTD